LLDKPFDGTQGLELVELRPRARFTLSRAISLKTELVRSNEKGDDLTTKITAYFEGARMRVNTVISSEEVGKEKRDEKRIDKEQTSVATPRNQIDL
jgi:hypothetical protein